MQILIVEDSPSVLLYLKALVEKIGFSPDLAKDGLEAWNKIRSNNYRMVITDRVMPNLDGVALCRKIRAADFNDYIYIILLTGMSKEGDVVDGLSAGADDYIKKPFNEEELGARVRSGQRVIELQDQNKKVLMQMAKTEKLASIGNLAEGISHEINTPAQYVGGNINFIEEVFNDYNELFDLLLKPGKTDKELIKSVEEKIEDIDLSYLKKEVPKAIAECIQGLNRITEIVSSMKEFSKPGVKDKIAVDLNKAIENTLTVSSHEWIPVAEIVKDFDLSLPLINCYPGDLNQVFLEIIINATHTIKDYTKGDNRKGVINISTGIVGDICEIRIGDTGAGIPEEIQSKIFDPFYTTKEVGTGTGQGLAQANSIITDMHKGSISFETKINKGTTFIINIPIDMKAI